MSKNGTQDLGKSWQVLPRLGKNFFSRQWLEEGSVHSVADTVYTYVVHVGFTSVLAVTYMYTQA